MTEGREQNNLHREIGEAIFLHFWRDVAVKNTKSSFDEILWPETWME